MPEPNKRRVAARWNKRHEGGFQRAWTLLSQAQETLWSPSTYDAEGTRYQLYSDQGVSIANSGFCQKCGARSWWWLRSVRAVDSLRFCYVYGDGEWRTDYADYDWGVSPGFCL